jgi:hypothetical protein
MIIGEMTVDKMPVDKMTRRQKKLKAFSPFLNLER